MIEPLSDRALERRIKRWMLTGPFACFVQTAPGLEESLVAELRDLELAHAPATERGGAAVMLDVPGIMRANLALRTAGRVLLRLGTFPASTPEMLHGRAAKLPWELHLGRAGRYSLRVVARRSRMKAGDAVADTVAAAVSRRLARLGLEAGRDDDAALEFHVRIGDDRCTVSLDTSGEHLHRRGMRTHVGDAPVRETIAAALALDAWRDHDLVLDPFCGSGTMLLEAADLATGRPPGRDRRFAFESAAWHRPGRWREVRRLAGADVDGAAGRAAPRLVGFDHDGDALAAARHNLAAAAHDGARLEELDSAHVDLDGLGASRGLVVSNLPYGVRLGDRDAAGRAIRRFLDGAAKASGRWDAAFLTMHPELLASHPAVRVERTRTVASGGLRVAWVTGTLGGGGDPTISAGGSIAP